MSDREETVYDRLVWRNSRIVAKIIHKMVEDTMPSKTCYSELTKMGITPAEFNELVAMSHDPLYEAETMGWDDGETFGSDVLLDEGVYELAKDAFRRIHATELEN